MGVVLGFHSHCWPGPRELYATVDSAAALQPARGCCCFGSGVLWLWIPLLSTAPHPPNDHAFFFTEQRGAQCKTQKGKAAWNLPGFGLCAPPGSPRGGGMTPLMGEVAGDGLSMLISAVQGNSFLSLLALFSFLFFFFCQILFLY